jgi:hypothetical protein
MAASTKEGVEVTSWATQPVMNYATTRTLAYHPWISTEDRVSQMHFMQLA